MIPATIQDHLRQHHMGWEHHHHRTATSAQGLAHAEHVTGYHVAKPVAVKVGGKRAMAVVSAAQRVRLGVLEEATGSAVELVPEQEMWNWFVPCDVGTEPPLSIFNLPIFVDADLLKVKRLLMPAGTYQDSILLDTDEWVRCEGVQEIPNLGTVH